MMGAGKYVPEHMLTYDISSMFEMGTGKVLSQEVAGTAGKTIADAAITDATTGSFDSGEFTLTCLNRDSGALPSRKSANSCREDIQYVRNGNG
jgi:hypothetical protein